MTSLLLGDLNDYIQPSVACIKPSTTASTSSTAIDSSTLPAPIVVNLKDCLACSGCITSAETVLVTQQTHQQLYDVLTSNIALSAERRRKVIVSVGAATQTALAGHYGLKAVDVWGKLVYFFKNVLGADELIDTTFTANFALRTAALEFVKRYRSSITDSNSVMRPMLSSECPGWICYAEKKLPAMLPQICTVRSPQQILGALVKSYLVEQYQRREPNRIFGRDDIFHVSIQPCYDKKLEASRVEFQHDEIRDVDCVIATTELISMIEIVGEQLYLPSGLWNFS